MGAPSPREQLFIEAADQAYDLFLALQKARDLIAYLRVSDGHMPLNGPQMEAEINAALAEYER